MLAASHSAFGDRSPFVLRSGRRLELRPQAALGRRDRPDQGGAEQCPDGNDEKGNRETQRVRELRGDFTLKALTPAAQP